MDPLEKIRDIVIEAAREGLAPNTAAAFLLKMSAHIVQVTGIADRDEWLEFATNMWYDTREDIAGQEEQAENSPQPDNVIKITF